MSLLAAAIPFAASAREEPLWEAGVGIAVLEFPDYRGSDRSRAYALPLPYFVYRGDIVKADRQGVRGMLFKTDRVDLNLSVGAALPVRSKDNPAREGMPDLRPSVEVGPSLAINAWRSEDRRLKLDLRLPLRFAATVESSPRFIGAQLFPHVNLDVHDPGGMDGWNLGLLTGPVFTDRRYNRYFYEVAPEFATAARPAYSPGGGYAGTQAIVALSKRFPSFWIAAFARYDTLRGARFEASPLVVSRNYVAGGVAVSWILGQSRERVAVDDYGDERR